MIKENKRAVWVGLFVLIGIAILVVGILTLGGQQKKFVKAVHLTAVFEEFGDKCDHVAGEGWVVGFLGVDAKPGEVLDPEQRRSTGFVFCQLSEVIVEALGR